MPAQRSSALSHSYKASVRERHACELIAGAYYCFIVVAIAIDIDVSTLIDDASPLVARTACQSLSLHKQTLLLCSCDITADTHHKVLSRDRSTPLSAQLLHHISKMSRTSHDQTAINVEHNSKNSSECVVGWSSSPSSS